MLPIHDAADCFVVTARIVDLAGEIPINGASNACIQRVAEFVSFKLCDL
jgi:hypothetical protein